MIDVQSQVAAVLAAASRDPRANRAAARGRHDIDWTTGACHDCDSDHGPSIVQEAHWHEVRGDYLEAALTDALARIADLEREKSLALRRLARQRTTAA
jgi:hypothetical protein